MAQIKIDVPVKTRPSRLTAAEFKKLAVAAARFADGKKAENIIVLDVSAESTLCDFVVIATADSEPQINAIGDEIAEKFKADGLLRTHIDGSDSSSWKVLDFGGVLIHVMTPEIREFYGLDKIFHFGAKVRWASPAPKTAVKKPAAKQPAVRKPAPRKAAR
ncbi:MAG: ribosome silencing factor [Elusimicrobiaceae bacterium]|nr:ribosome silencing factor [Elusimicrobiaceae bacterium]